MRRLMTIAALSTAIALFACGDDETTSATTATSSSSGTASSSSSGSGGASSSASSSGSGGQTSSSSGTGGSGGTSGSGGSGGAAAFALSSSVFTEGAVLPGKYVCTNDTAQGGTNVSPPLSWTAGPSGTMSYAIVMRDLDFMNGFVHWVIWDIPANVTSLPEDVEHADQPSAPAGAKQADFNGSVTGYYGPCSPSNVNTYEFTLYAMPNATTSGPVAGGDKNAAASSIESQAIGSTTLSTES